MAEAIEEENQGVKRTLKDLFGGAVGGVTQVLIGMFSYMRPVSLGKKCNPRMLECLPLWSTH